MQHLNPAPLTTATIRDYDTQAIETLSLYLDKDNAYRWYGEDGLDIEVSGKDTLDAANNLLWAYGRGWCVTFDGE